MGQTPHTQAHTHRQKRSAAGDKWAVEDINAWRGNINIQIQAADLMLFNLMEGKYTLWLYQRRVKEWEENTDTGIEQDCLPVCLQMCVACICGEAEKCGQKVKVSAAKSGGVKTQ